jgi:hypothetical protein
MWISKNRVLSCIFLLPFSLWFLLSSPLMGEQGLEAKENLAFVLLDGSLGFHNYEHARELIQKASLNANEARKALGRASSAR